MGTLAGQLLRSAADIVDGDRNQQHGAKERSFTCIAALWTLYLQQKSSRAEVSARDVAVMMVLMKIARSIHGEAIQDHFVDMAGYAAIAGELAAAAGESLSHQTSGGTSSSMPEILDGLRENGTLKPLRGNYAQERRSAAEVASATGT